MSNDKKKVLLVDGHSILNRAFYGMPDLTNAKGIHTGAVYGFLHILFSQLDELKPDYLTVAFDVHAPTFRHDAYEAYKGTRKAMPEELRQQVPLIKQMLGAMGIVTCEQAGLEADDILGTLARKAEARDMDVVLLSGDRDLLQIATDRICIRSGSASEVLGKLEKAGYICRTVSEADRRGMDIALTREGETHARETTRLRNAWISSQFSSLTEAEKETLLEILEKLSRDWQQRPREQHDKPDV